MNEPHWKIDFLIPTFNRPQKLYFFLKMAFSLGIPSARFVVMDDCSSVYEEIPELGKVCTEEVCRFFEGKPLLYLKPSVNQGIAANITHYYQQHSAADYTILLTDKDKLINAAPILNAIKKMDEDPTLSLVVIPIHQNDNEAQDQLLSFHYNRMTGSHFIKNYIDDTMLQHCVGYSIVRVAAAKKVGVPRSINLRAFGLEDSFGFDLDYFLMIASTGDVDFESQPHVCRTVLGGLTERFPLTFAYCYYQYAKRALKELHKKKTISKKDVKKSATWWNLLMLRGLVIVYQPSERRDEVDVSRIKRHLKIPVLLYFLIQYVQYKIWPTEEMKKLLYMHYLENVVKNIKNIKRFLFN